MNTMKSICSVFYVSPVMGRANSDVYGFAKVLTSRGCEISLILLENKNACHMGSSFNIYPVLNLVRPRTWIVDILKNVRVIWRIVSGCDADIVVVSSELPTLLPVFLFKMFVRKPMIVYCRELLEETVQSKYRSRVLRLLRSFMLKHADSILSIDLGIRQYLLRELGHRVEIQYLPSIVDLEMFNPFVDGKKMRDKLGLGNSLVILYLGTMSPYRRLDLLVEAFSRLVKVWPDARLVMGGAGERVQLLEKVQELGLDKYVIFLDWLPYHEIPEIIAASDICVDPYPRSGIEEFQISLKLLEYMAVGKCTVASDNAGNRQLILDKYNGILVAQGSVVDLANRLEELAFNRSLRENLGRNAYNYVNKTHDGSKSLRTLENVFEKLIN